VSDFVGRRGKRLKELRRRVRHRRDGEVIVDGRRLVDDLVRWKVPIRELYLATDLSEAPEVAGWSVAASALYTMEPSVLLDVAPTRSPQGVLAVVGEPFFQRWEAVAGFGVWLDGVQDPGNVGAVIRSAAALGAAAVLLSADCADPFGPVAVRGSAGAVFRVPVERDVAVDDAAERVRQRGGAVWATGDSGTPIDSWRPVEPCLVLVGSEGAGLSSAAADLADAAVTVPLDNDIDSLNVAVAVGILLQRLRR
jgi:TrmH family RNA methyltransferase